MEIQNKVKEIPEKEMNFIFSVQYVKVVDERKVGVRDEWDKLYIIVKDEKSGSEIKYEYLNLGNLNNRDILRNIEKLYGIYRRTENDKLAEGAK